MMILTIWFLNLPPLQHKVERMTQIYCLEDNRLYPTPDKCRIYIHPLNMMRFWAYASRWLTERSYLDITTSRWQDANLSVQAADDGKQKKTAIRQCNSNEKIE